MTQIDFQDFLDVDIRIGTIIDAKIFEKARKPAYQLWVNFGDTIGVKKTSAQVTKHYTPEDLIGKQIIGVVNFPPKQIADFMSEFLILGVSDDNGDIVLMHPSKPAPNGGRLH
jgi:tRNA-binding protein